MAEFNIYKLIYELLFIIVVTSATAETLLPVSSRYIEHTLADPGFCPQLHRGPPFRLSNQTNAAFIVKHSHIYRKWQKSCEFTVKAYKGESLMAVIQNMYLRGNSSKCLDYIKFRRKDGQDKTICGHIDPRLGIFEPIQEYANDLEMDNRSLSDSFGEFEVKGEIETFIFLSSDRLENNEQPELTIVYTPYKDCRKLKLDRDEYKNITVDTDSKICMWKEYFCDRYRNCVAALCRDEADCEFANVVSDGTGTKVTIGAVTTMFLCFIIFLMGLWICKKYKKLCWSSDCAGPMSHDNRSDRADREADIANPSIAVSPMLEVAVLPSALNKDLPPSYDSLFPEQSNPSTT